MNEKDFLNWCKKVVAEYTNKHLDKSDKKEITADDVFMVWCCKTLQNNKALLSTTLFDGMYYECTYNGDKQEIYIDAYKKWENFAVKRMSQCVLMCDRRAKKNEIQKETSNYRSIPVYRR